MKEEKYLLHDCCFSMADRQVLIFSSVGHNLNETLDLCFVVEGHAEQL